jgi:membrane protease YdiL (CAAX protease family)
MQPSTAESILVWGVALFAFASVSSWRLLTRRNRSGQALVDSRPREPVPWKAIDVLLVFALYAALSLFAARLGLSLAGVEVTGESKTELADLEPQQAATIVLAGSAGSLLSMLLAGLLLRWRAGASLADLGLATDGLVHDVKWGVVAFFGITPAVYALQWALVRYVKESAHPLVELLERSTEVPLLLAALLAAVVVAPLVEEFLFRVVLQGWMERQTAGSEAPVARRGIRYWIRNPVVGSSFVFALMHLGHGPDPIPLFFLALVLGYLYQQTHRMWASTTVHFCNNACSLMLFLLALQAS